jgi:hypothetical protein
MPRFTVDDLRVVRAVAFLGELVANGREFPGDET